MEVNGSDMYTNYCDAYTNKQYQMYQFISRFIPKFLFMVNHIMYLIDYCCTGGTLIAMDLYYLYGTLGLGDQVSAILYLI